MSDSNGSRQRPLEVISLGMPRTGTASMRLALETLGYGPVMHAYEVADNPPLADACIPLLHAKYEQDGERRVTREMLDRALGGYGACTDVPCATFWEELIDLYPEAKIILIERDVDAWYKSFKLVIDNTLGLQGNIMRYLIEPISNQRVMYMLQLMYQKQFRGESAKEIMANARAVYAEHYAGIRNKAPKERLLEMKLEDGWKPLCEFLGKEVPEVPFPRVNDAEDFQKKVDATMAVYARTALKVVALPALLLSGAIVAWYLYR